MLKIRTSKAIQTSLHTDEEYKIEFQFSYERIESGMKVKVVPYNIKIDDTLELVRGAETHRVLSNEQLDFLIDIVKAMTPTNDDPLIYFDSLIGNGIKVVIAEEGLWKGQLTLNDFE